MPSAPSQCSYNNYSYIQDECQAPITDNRRFHAVLLSGQPVAIIFCGSLGYIVHRYNEAKEIIYSLKNKQGKIPLASWQREHTELSVKLRELDGRYQVVKEKVARVNKFRVRVYDVLRKEQREHQRTQPTKKRSYDAEL